MTQTTVRDVTSFSACTYMLLGFSLSPTGATSKTPGALRRAGTLVRSPMDGRRDKEKVHEGDMTAQEVQSLYCLHGAAFSYQD